MNHLKAKDIMRSDVVVVSEKMHIEELISILTIKEISGAPVINDEGKLIGVVSLMDIVKDEVRKEPMIKNRSKPNFYTFPLQREIHNYKFDKETHKEKRVEDIMSPIVIKVKEEAQVRDMAKTMVDTEIHRLIVAKDEQVVGIVSSMDMLKTIYG